MRICYEPSHRRLFILLIPLYKEQPWGNRHTPDSFLVVIVKVQLNTFIIFKIKSLNYDFITPYHTEYILSNASKASVPSLTWLLQHIPNYYEIFCVECLDFASRLWQFLESNTRLMPCERKNTHVIVINPSIFLKKFWRSLMPAQFVGYQREVPVNWTLWYSSCSKIWLILIIDQ